MLHNVGAAIGRMDAALQAFTHTSLRRNLQWDLALVLGVRAFVPHVTQPDRGALAEMWLSEFETAVLPSAANLLLPKQVRSRPRSDNAQRRSFLRWIALPWAFSRAKVRGRTTPYAHLGRAPLSEALWVGAMRLLVGGGSLRLQAWRVEAD
jgi:hypothetical protein